MQDQIVPLRERIPVVGDRVVLFRATEDGVMAPVRSCVVGCGLYAGRGWQQVYEPGPGKKRCLVQRFLVDREKGDVAKKTELILLHRHEQLPLNVYFGVAMTSPEKVIFIAERRRRHLGRLPVND